MAVKSTLRSDAEAHIAKIRHGKGLSEDSPSSHNVSDLENALTTLSEQLYQSSTHFLLELIQNADDNTYESNVQPCMHFTYSNGCLRVDCNEVGFSPRNVEALCRVGQSTKKGGDNATRYVGEKGIGFKSVFKAADVVWICSSDYSFKFDKTKPLGMIAPIWDDFPAPVKPGFTSFYLQLSESYNRRGLLDELRSLDSRLLIFLRRLRSITVSISEPLRKTWKSSFSRAEIGKDLIRLVENNKACDYIVTRHQVANMPQESKRQGVSSSEIILSFPITEEKQPKRESQQAYAFLPIRHYGFEFLIQADFILIASREDIDDSSEWNHALRGALSSAFADTMIEFTKGELRYLWPRYLPTREPLHSFLRPFHLELREKIASLPVLYSQSGELVAPHTLTYVPEEFTFNGAPITISSQTSGRYLSGRYLQSDVAYLEILGVEVMSELTFFLELEELLLNEMGKFKAKSDAWHSHLASILMRFSQQYASQLTNLTIVPLNDGSWVAAGGRQILFPANKAEFELPGGLELSVVHAGAANDPARRTLFKFLGVGDLEQEPVVRHIQALHTRMGRASSRAVSRDALVSQIKFLYSTGWKNPTFQRFWFTSESGQRLHGSQLYQDSSKPYSATKFFGAHRNKFRFIHKDYMAAAGENRESWVRWLEEKMGVATMPTLVESTPDKGFKLSDDFEFIIKNFPSSEVLLLLRENWGEYSKFFDTDQVQKWKKDNIILEYDSTKFSASVSRLKQKLGSMLVTCTTGKKHRLDTTFLPSRELLLASQDGVPFVDIPDADDLRWEVLKTLGVSIKVDVSFYLRSLERLQADGSDDGIRVEKLLNTIQLRCDDEAEASIVKKTFGIKKMVYVPPTRQGRRQEWILLSRCRWKGPPTGKDSQDLRTFESLKDVYPGNKRLFVEILGVQDATLNDLVQEARYFATGDSLSHISTMFHTMEKLMEDDPTSSRSEIRDLRTYKIFPVSKNWNVDTDRVSALENANVSSEWFIADTAPLRTIFAGVVPLLEINVDKLPQMDRALREIGLKSRFLSKQVSSVPRTQGAVQLNQELTDTFRSKVDFIIRLLPTEKHYRKRRPEMIKQLRNLQVYTADEVIQEWRVRYKGKWVKGPPGNGNVALVAENDILKIYLAAKGGFETDQTPVELVDEVFNFCGILTHNPEHSEMCLHVALSQSNPTRISKVFADKGIPSLESLKFADADKSNSDEDEEYPRAAKSPETKGSSSSGPKERSRPFRDLSVAEVIFGLPVGIATGLGGLVNRNKHFDGKDDEDDTWGKTDVETTKEKPMAKKPKSLTSDKQRRCGADALQKFHKSVSKGWLIVQQVAFSSACVEDVAFKGELVVHKVLAETLGQNYNPRQHWTSQRRARANLPAFYSNDENKHSAFKFSDVTGTFTQLLNNDGYPAANNWLTRPPTYHIDVKSTRGDIHAEFSITPAQFQRARDLSIMMQQMKGDIDSIPTDIYILVRVYEVDIIATDENGKEKDGSKIAFLVDPWEYYHADRLILKHKGHFVGSMV